FATFLLVSTSSEYFPTSISNWKAVMKILIGIDGSEFSDAALDEVSRRTWPAGSEILLVHAFELPLAATPEVWALPPDYYERLEHLCRQHSEEIMKAAATKLLRAAGIAAVTPKIVLGAPKNVILEQAENWTPDLIVVGSHGYPTWERLL